MTHTAELLIFNQMVKLSAPGLNHTFASLADPTRRAMVARLAEGDCSVSELAKPFDVSLPAISRHLRVLERAGMVVQDRQGRVRRCHLVAEPMKEAAKWIDQYRDQADTRALSR